MEGAAIHFLLFCSLFFHKIYAAELDNISGKRFLTEGDTLVSGTRTFELGFFRPEGSENRYLGIWFKKVSSVRTVVWVANREYPLPGASSLLVLKIVDPGILAIYSNNSIVWSSNTTMTSRNATAKLYDTGNLVLMDQQEKTMIWQSFDYPTDTLLPGMKLGKDYLRDIEWHLSSWKSSQDPAPSEFTWGANIRGYPETKLKQGVMVKYRGGPWSNRQISGNTAYGTNLTTTYSMVINEKEVSFSYYTSGKNLMLSRVTLISSGALEGLAWVEDGEKWQLSLTLPTDICDTYNICSAYGSCSVNIIQQSCACLDEKRFVPQNQKGWERADWSGGCVRRTPLDCKNGSEGFIKYSNVKLPDTERTWFNMSMNLKECETKCLRNCTCTAYANPDTRSGAKGCLLWFGDLFDIRVLPEGGGGRDIFVRMASSELVAQSIFKKTSRRHIKIILLVTLPGVFLVGFIFTWIWYARSKGDHLRPTWRGGSIHVSKNKDEDFQLPLLSFSTIATATSSFSTDNILGEGGFGPVYKGVLEGIEIAVKRLSQTSNQGDNEFQNEVICISRLQHRNLVKLLGCCIEKNNKLLIYEYMPNNSLDSFIFDENKRMLLDWTKRFNIIKGIARGLLYLHHDSRLRIIHRDLKAGNILLDQDMNPKISDFGLARSFPGNQTQANTKRVVGTHGYMSPEYVLDGLFSMKSDVFSFGVLVLEIVSGKRNRGFIHPGHDNNLIGHAWSIYNAGNSMELLDSVLSESSTHPSEVVRSIQIGLLCVQQNAGDRPSMSSVVRMLDGEGALPQPKQPAFFMGRDLLVINSSSSNNPSGSYNGLSITHLDAR